MTYMSTICNKKSKSDILIFMDTLADIIETQGEDVRVLEEIRLPKENDAKLNDLTSVCGEF